jgi:hypothetical protein
MAEAALVDADIAFGRELVEALDLEPPEAGLRPSAAFWFFFPDESTWRLVLALPAMETEEPQEVYRKVLDVMNRRVRDLSRPTDAIGLAPPDVPIAQLLRSAIHTGSEGVAGIRFTHNVINGQLVDDAYIYRVT